MRAGYHCQCNTFQFNQSKFNWEDFSCIALNYIFLRFSLTTFRDTFSITFRGESSRGDTNCRVRTEQIQRSDGSVLVRYRPTVTCWNVQLSIKWRDQHVGESPYALKDRLYPENCHCPQSLGGFLENCPRSDDQIDKDLNAFRMINYTRARQSLLDQFEKSSPGALAVCQVTMIAIGSMYILTQKLFAFQYIVKDQRVFRRCFGQHVGFKMFMDSLLLSLTRKATLPDLELFVNLGDWPIMKKGGQSRTIGPRPVFSWCGSDDSFDIVLPTYDLTESTLEAMNRVTLDIISVQQTRVPWKDKSDRAFWRGRDANRQRLDLAQLSQRHPDLINASLTNFFFFRDEEKRFPKAPYVPFFRFFDYKYSINVDGTVAAYRLPYLLAGDSLLLKQDSPYYEHFYKKLVPYEHFVPFKRDLSDLPEKIRWAKDNEDLVLKIVERANRFANEHLMPMNIFCYHMLLLQVRQRESSFIIQPP